ncbi:MAG: TonB-dependent receptor [Saprospiraceae bacterium]
MFAFKRNQGRKVLPDFPASNNRRFLFFPVFFLLFSGLQAQQIDTLALRTVVVQATRADTRSPVPHNNISAEQIEKTYQVQDVPFLLSGIPSLVESSDAGAGVGYTGMRIRGSDPTRINVTINGVPLNDAESQGMFWVDLPDLAASAAEIQVQRGVGTSTNGAGAFGATVNLDLSRVIPEPYALVNNTFGSFSTRKHSAAFGTGLLGQKFAFSGRASAIRSDGYIQRARADLDALHFTGAFIDEDQSLQMHFLSGHEITYQAWNGVPAQFIDMDALRNYNTAGTERPGAPYDNEVDDYTQRYYLLHYKRRFRHGLYLQLNGHYTRGYGFYEQYKAQQAFSGYGLPELTAGDTVIGAGDLVRRRWLDNHFYGATFALRWQPPVNFDWMSGAPVLMLGGAFSRYEGLHYGEVIWAEYQAGPFKDLRYYENDADKSDVNVFAKLEMAFSGGVSTFLDLQVRGVDYRFLGYDNNLENVGQDDRLLFFNPKAGVTYAWNKKWSAYAFFGVGQREPNRDDYTQSTPASRPRPERLYDLETGVKTGGEKWKATLNFFHMYYRDQLAPDGRLNDVGAYIRTNLPGSYRSGLEMEASAALGSRMGLSGNLSLSRNKVTKFTEYRDNWDTGEQEKIVHRNTDLAFSPSVLARGEVFCILVNKPGDQDLTVALSGKYVGRQYLDNTSNASTALPAYFFSDLRLNYNLKGVVGKEISVILGVQNVFDARYSSNGWAYRFISEGYDPRPDDPYSRLEGNGTYHLAGYFPQAGRNWLSTLRLRF